MGCCYPDQGCASCVGLLPICISIKVVWSSQELFFVKETLILSIYEYKDVLLVILRQENVHIFALIIVSIEFLVFGVLYYDSYVCVA